MYKIRTNVAYFYKILLTKVSSYTDCLSLVKKWQELELIFVVCSNVHKFATICIEFYMQSCMLDFSMHLKSSSETLKITEFAHWKSQAYMCWNNKGSYASVDDRFFDYIIIFPILVVSAMPLLLIQVVYFILVHFVSQ